MNHYSDYLNPHIRTSPVTVCGGTYKIHGGLDIRCNGCGHVIPGGQSMARWKKGKHQHNSIVLTEDLDRIRAINAV